MTFTILDESLLVTDLQGRVRVPQERREKLLDEFERSGLSGRRFAQLAGLKYQTFAVWVQKRSQRAKLAPTTEASKQSVRFAEAMVNSSQSPARDEAGLIIEWPGGARAVVRSPLQLQMAAELLRMERNDGRRC